MEQTNLFDQQFGDQYRQENSQPTNPENRLPEKATAATASVADAPVPARDEGIPPKPFGLEWPDVINTMLPGGVAEGQRHTWALKVASDVILFTDGNIELARKVLLTIDWVQGMVNDGGMKELDDILSAAKKRMQKREAENLTAPQPSQAMRRAIEKLSKRKYSELVREANNKVTGTTSSSDKQNIVQAMERMGDDIRKLMSHYPMLRLACHRLQRKHYIAALFVVAAFAMTLCTRMHYAFWPAPGRKCRMNCILELIGRMGNLKHILVQFHDLMMQPVKDADKAQEEALNRWNEEREQKSGSDKNKTPRPKGIYRDLPCSSSAAAIREAEFNAIEEIDGERFPLHVSIMDSELDNTLRQMTKGYMDYYTLWLKSFHNEPQGSFLKTSSSRVGSYDVHANFMYSGTEYALNKQVNVNNYATGLPTRITPVPMADSSFQMMENHEYDDADRQRDEQLRETAYRLNDTYGFIDIKPISDALYQWTARRMEDAKENESLAEEDLLKRCCWVAANNVIPFVIDRHWDKMVQVNGRWKCGPDFKVDKTDMQLALLICNAQWQFQLYWFKHIAEQYYDGQRVEQASQTHHQERTRLAYMRLPNPCTPEDIDREYGYNGNSINSRAKRLVDDGLLQKIRTGKDKGKYRKLA